MKLIPIIIFQCSIAHIVAFKPNMGSSSKSIFDSIVKFELRSVVVSHPVFTFRAPYEQSSQALPVL